MPDRTPAARNRALDNLRVVAMLLGLVTHGVLPFKATGIGRYPIRDCHTHPAADAVYFAVHDFRMELFFVVAGFAAAGLGVRKGAAELARNRLRRVVLPLLLAVLVVSPLMHVLFTYHRVDRASGGGGFGWLAVADRLRFDLWTGPNFHLWFLYYLALCCVPLALALGPAGRAVPGRVVRLADAAFRRLLGWRWKPALLAAALVPVLWTMEDWWIETPQGWVPHPTILAYYLAFFLFGAMLQRHRDRLPAFGRRWAVTLLAANLVVLPLMLKLTIAGLRVEDQVDPRTPAWLVAWKAAAIFLGGLYTWLMIEGLVGLFQRHFAGTSGWWTYLADASYWCYLAGFPVQVALQVWLAEHPMPIPAKFALVNAVTFAVLLTSYEFAVRHTWVGVLLNGRRPERAAVAVPVPEPVVFAARMGLPVRTVVVRRENRVPSDDHVPLAPAELRG